MMVMEMSEIPDYMKEELGTDRLPEFTEAGAENVTGEMQVEVKVEEQPAEKAETLPMVVEPAEVEVVRQGQYQVNVEGVTYSANHNRLYLVSQKGDRPVENFISSLIVVVANASDASSGNWGRVVRFLDESGAKKEVFIKNSDIATNGGGVLRALVDEGLRVSTDNRMKDALMNYLNLAPPLDPKLATCSDRIGWHGNLYLLSDNSVIGKAENRVVFSGSSIGRTATKGDVNEWRDKVASLCRGNSLLVLSACVAFASVLLRLLRIESGGFHIFGESSTGKSTTLHVAASVFGEPDSMFGTWRSTSNGTEGRAKKCNDSLMILDELHQSTPREAGDAAYMIMNGKGKQRANVLGDARDVFEWRVNCLSSGEVSYAAFIKSGGTDSRAGQEVRMVDISADVGSGMGIFESIHGAKDGHTFAEGVKKVCAEVYGTPARVFLARLIANMDQLERSFDGVKEEFFEEFLPPEASGQVQRVASKFAVAALAGEMATSMGLTGWGEGEAYQAIGKAFTKWLANRGTTGQQESEKAIEQVRSFLRANGMSRFMPVTERSGGGYGQDGTQRTISNMAGYRVEKMGNVHEYIVFPHVFTTEMCLGLNVSTATKTLVERGYLLVDNGKPQVRRRMPGGGQARYYHFTSTILVDIEEEEAASETETAVEVAENTGMEATFD